ncbi:iron-containing alcohol dehydrogenase [Halodesulfovibrio marinisediminis]|uniref:Alcohol dehydrogenase n=1 Tax=Halodesulfovibrio marinisediminis DSM 17456 TaxID=1121457 RepID=A0A1N6FXM6_9BACT|nr:iron-containing alcohol dehydrogenase [Halodesulfovibrio marinisediminis]SIN99940.1 alcohol dehydrogenase [Halodesulfovibrio marinisediminis DSM 17456]
MDAFTYSAPTQVIFGQDAVDLIGWHIVKEASSVLLVLGGGSARNNGAYEATIRSLQEAGVDWTEFWGIKPNPSLDQIEAGINIARKASVGAVLGVGGGSVIDAAKAIAAGVYLDDYWERVESRKTVERSLPVYTVVTLSGTGSEMNGKAVITNERMQKKWSLGGHCMIPKVTAIDPLYQVQTPWKITAGSGIDAMTHIMENYFRGRIADKRTGYFNEETTLNICEGLLISLINSLHSLHHDPSNYEARANLAWASCLSLNGLTGCGLSGGDWTSHALEHALSGRFPHIPHGEGLAVIFPSWMQQVCAKAPEIFNRFAATVWGQDTIQGGIDATRAAFSSWGAPSRLSGWGVTEEDVPHLVDSAFAYRDLGRIAPLSKDDVAEIFMRIL